MQPRQKVMHGRKGVDDEHDEDVNEMIMVEP